MVQDIKAKHGINFTQIAKRVKVAQSTIQRIATGETKDCRASVHSKIKDLYNSLNDAPNKTP